jgi:hypothetical protein
MAKGKGAVALFEVIHKDKRFDRKTPEAAPKTPPPPKAPEAAQKPPVQASPDLAAHAVDLWRKRHSDPETWTTSPPKIKEPLTAQISALIAKISAACRSAFAQSAKTAASFRHWVVRQNSAVCGVTAAIIVIGGLLLARHWYHPTNQAIPIEQVIRSQPPHPSVLAVSTSQMRSSADPNSLSPEMQADVQQANDKITPTLASSSLAQSGARIVNMHYVLMQSYFEEKTAIEARDFLVKSGIPCTIERGVKGWRSDFYQVIGLQGFARPSGPEYVAYRTQIVKLGPLFSKSRYKRFQPEAIKW